MATPALKVGDRVKDTWWPYNPGRVVRVGKTRIRIKFECDTESPARSAGNPVSYDIPHARAFLRKA